MIARLVLILAISLLPACAPAQDAALLPYLKQHFEGSTLVFRRPIESKNQIYSNSGELIESEMPASLPLYGIFRVDQVKIDKQDIVFSGNRIVLFFEAKPASVKSFEGEKLKLTLRGATALAGGGVLQALQRIFVAKTVQEIAGQYSASLSEVPKGKPVAEVFARVKDGCDVYRVVDKVITPPKPLHTPDPEYTQKAREKKVIGTSIWAVIINQFGRVEAMAREKGLEESVDVNAVRAIRTWRFEPAKKQNEPVCVRVNIEVKMELW